MRKFLFLFALICFSITSQAQYVPITEKTDVDVQYNKVAKQLYDLNGGDISYVPDGQWDKAMKLSREVSRLWPKTSMAILMEDIKAKVNASLYSDLGPGGGQIHDNLLNSLGNRTVPIRPGPGLSRPTVRVVDFYSSPTLNGTQLWINTRQ
jgi:hypothetical protein